MAKLISPHKAPGSTRGRSLWEWLFRAAFIVGLVFLAFVTGAALTAADVFPGRYVDRAYFGAKAVYERFTAYRDIYTSKLWYAERSPSKGVTVFQPGRVQPGVTVYTSAHDAAAFLVGMDGKVLHTWERPYSTVWEPGVGIPRPKPDTHVWFRKVVVYPNGDLLAVYEAVGDTPYGYGLVRLNRDSEVIWSYFGRAHHDVDVGSDGRVYALTHEIVDEPLEGFDNLRVPRLDDFLVVLSPEGEELKKVSVIDAVANSSFNYLLHTVSWYAVGDALHTNSVDFIDRGSAANFVAGEPGQVLLSLRELNAVVVLDIEEEEIVWAMRGPWIAQHDADVLPNGNVLLFDNRGNFQRPNGISRVIEVDPQTMEIVWQYAGTAKRPLASEIRSSQQRLPNGNTLITESSGGRLLEVTRAGEIVWEYFNPARGGERDSLIPILDWAQRLDPTTFDPEFRRFIGMGGASGQRTPNE